MKFMCVMLELFFCFFEGVPFRSGRCSRSASGAPRISRRTPRDARLRRPRDVHGEQSLQMHGRESFHN